MAAEVGSVVLAVHFTVTARGRAPALLEPVAAAYLWHRLRERVPEAYACVLMPDHLHLLGCEDTGPRLRRALISFTRRFGVRFDTEHT